MFKSNSAWKKITHQNNNKINVKILTENHKEIITTNKIILKSQQIFSKNEKYDIFTEEVNKIVLSLNGDRRIQSIDSIETYA